jgi:hypothetical protein
MKPKNRFSFLSLSAKLMLDSVAKLAGSYCSELTILTFFLNITFTKLQTLIKITPVLERQGRKKIIFKIPQRTPNSRHPMLIFKGWVVPRFLQAVFPHVQNNSLLNLQ